MIKISDDRWSWSPSPRKGESEMSIQICRMCLATDGITSVDPALWRALTEVTGVLWFDERLPNDLCVQCKALVTKCQKFLSRAQRVNDTLLQFIRSDKLNLTTINRIKRKTLRVKPFLSPKHYPPNHCDLHHDADSIENVRSGENNSIIKEKNSEADIQFVVGKEHLLGSPTNEEVVDEGILDVMDQDGPQSDREYVTMSDIVEDVDEVNEIINDEIPDFTDSASVTNVPQENTITPFRTDEKYDNCHNGDELESSFTVDQVADNSQNTKSGRIMDQPGEMLPGPVGRETSQPKNTGNIKLCEERKGIEQKDKKHFTNILELLTSVEVCAPSTSTVTENLVKVTNTSTAKRNTWIQCDLSRNSSAESMLIKRVKKRRIREKKFLCNFCDYRCAHMGFLNEHIRTHTGEKPYECSLCDYKSARSGGLKAHLKTHSVDKLYTCEICGIKLSTSCGLKKHIRHHNGEKRFACDFCGQKFHERINLADHIRTHTGEKPYSCNKCDYKAARKSRLNIHLRTHTGVKPHMCIICNHTFSEAYYLKKHLLTHTGEKAFTCAYCNNKFSSKRLLANHISTHTGEKPYACKFCDYKCSDSGNLSKHLKTHTGEKPYACNICDRKFSRRNVMQGHMKNVHKTGKP